MKAHLRSVSAIPDSGSLQTSLTEFLKPLCCAIQPATYMSMRMRRWGSAVSEAAQHWWGISCPFFLHMCQKDLCGAPMRVIAACLKTALNGWASTRRFQQSKGKCIFNCGSQQDCIEHYLTCPKVNRIWWNLNQNEWGPFECRLAVGCTQREARVQRAFFLYGLFTVYNFLRHNHGMYDIQHLTAMLKQHVRIAVGRSTSDTRSFFHEQANSRGNQMKEPACDIVVVGDVMFSSRKWGHRTEVSGKVRAETNGKRMRDDRKRQGSHSNSVANTRENSRIVAPFHAALVRGEARKLSPMVLRSIKACEKGAAQLCVLPRERIEVRGRW